MIPKSKFSVTLDWEQCELIASYYMFPTTILLWEKKTMKHHLKGTRQLNLRKKILREVAGVLRKMEKEAIE